MENVPTPSPSLSSMWCCWCCRVATWWPFIHSLTVNRVIINRSKKKNIENIPGAQDASATCLEPRAQTTKPCFVVWAPCALVPTPSPSLPLMWCCWCCHITAWWPFICSLTVNRAIISRNKKKEYGECTWGTNDETLFRRLGPLCPCPHSLPFSAVEAASFSWVSFPGVLTEVVVVGKREGGGLMLVVAPS